MSNLSIKDGQVVQVGHVVQDIINIKDGAAKTQDDRCLETIVDKNNSWLK